MRTLLFGLVLATAACSSKQPAPPTNATQPAKAVPIAEAKTQEEARTSATATDLPLVKTADRAVITKTPPGGDKSTVEASGADLAKLVGTLAVSEQAASGGMQFAKIAFYKGPELLREIWVYGDGEWGFVRPGTSWTVGREAALGELVR